MKLFLCPVYPKSLYNRLLMREFGDRFEPVFRDDGGLAEALQCLERGEKILIHVQWEEFFFADARTLQDANQVVATVECQLRRIAMLGGIIVWTVHNGQPHMIGHVPQFLKVRGLLALLADRILVHNRASEDFLQNQVPVPDAQNRIILLPHPSYAGLYEPEGAAVAAIERASFASEKFVLGFGAIRKQKGFCDMCDALDSKFTRDLKIRLRIAGQGAEGQALKQSLGHRDDIDWDLGYVPMEDVPPLFRAAKCVILPYTHLLTSGVAVLALTLGAIIVAPALPTFLELLPNPLRRFLYAPGDPTGLARVVADVLRLSPQEEQACRLVGIASVASVHPSLISRQLLAIYRDLLADRYGQPFATHALTVDHAGA